MDERMRYLLLRILYCQGSVDALEKTGYQYAAIAREYSNIINEGLVAPNAQYEFVLTKQGENEMRRLKDKLSRQRDFIVEPYVKYKKRPMDKYDIYLE